MASQLLVRSQSTVARPSAQLALRTQVRPAPTSPARPVGLRMQSTSPAKEQVKLDWDSFFKLRASRRRYSLASSIATSLVSTTIGVQILSGQDLESLGAQVMGLDPFVVLGMATAACGAVGWLAGPMVGNGVWGLVYRRFKPSVAIVSLQIDLDNSSRSNLIHTVFSISRKRKNSSTAFANTALTLPPTRSPIPSPTTTVRRLAV